MIRENIFIDFKTPSGTYSVYNGISYSDLAGETSIYFDRVLNKELLNFYTDEPGGTLTSGVSPRDLSNKVIVKLLDSPSLFCETWNDETRSYEQENLASHPSFNRPSGFPTSQIGKKLIQNLYTFNNEENRSKEDYGVDFYQVFGGTVTHESNSDLFDKIEKSHDHIVYYTIPSGFYYVVPQGSGQVVLDAEVRVSMFIAEPQETAIKRTVLENPVIFDIPETKAGNQYDPQVSFTDNIEYGFGHVVPPSRANPKGVGQNTKEFALLETHYNNNTHRFEAGTRQILVRIIQPIAACNTPGLDLTKEDTIDSPISLYAKDNEENQIGDFDEAIHTGSGVVLNKQKNNMYLWGPNFQRIKQYAIDAENDTTTIQKETVILVNRTGAAFAENELAFASKIDGEWAPIKIPQGIADGVRFGVQKWSFQKLIASADDFFRDARYLDDTQPDYVKQRINPEDYEAIARNRFYYYLKRYNSGSLPGSRDVSHLTDISPNIFDLIGYMNLGNSDASVTENEKPENWDFVPSNGYIQVTAFDQMGNFAGGKNKANVIARTNYLQPLDSTQDDTDPLEPFEMMEYWGPTFPRGYDTEDVSRLLNSKSDIHMSSMPILSPDDSFFFDASGDFIAPDGGDAIVDNLPSRNVSIKYKDKGMFYNVRDKSALQLPADAATNGPPNSLDYSPIEKLQYLDLVSDTGVNVVDSYYKIFEKDPKSGMQARFNWLYKRNDSDPLSGILEPVYGFKPNSPNSIHFYPLAAEVVSSTDYNRGGTSPEAGVALEYGMLPLMAKASEIRSAPWHSSQTANGVDHLLGSDALFKRNGEPLTDFIQYSYNGFSSPADPAKKNYTIPYFGYVQKKATGTNSISLPTIWPDENDENASCVGIIASKCRITFRGSELKFLLDQQFGLQLDSRATLATGGSFNFLPLGGGLGVPLVGGSSFSTSNSYPRWGGISDEPNVFNTTALHMKMFDAWPDSQTIYDAKYFSVFHFNPGEIFSKPSVEMVNGLPKVITINKNSGDSSTLDFPILTETVDFKMVTDIDGNIFPVTKTAEGLLGQEVDKDTEFAPQDNWRVNTIRRGMMLTSGGFTYFKTFCGLSKDLTTGSIRRVGSAVDGGGINYKVGDLLSVSGGSGVGARVRITAVADSAGTILTNVGAVGGIRNLEVVERGTGFVPEDFVGDPTDVSTYKLRLSGGSGSGADFRVTKGIIYGVEFTDGGPQNKSNGYIRLTNSNSNGQGNQGTGFVTGTTEQFLPVEDPNVKGEYDLFFYFHNDVTHTVHYGGGNMLIEPQRVSMEISAL